MRYREFFQIEIDHPSFPDPHTDLMFIPDKRSFQFLGNAPFSVKHTEKGVKVLVAVDAENKLPLINTEDTIVFNLYPTTNRFEQVTDKSGKENGGIVLFTNEEVESEELEETENSVLNGFSSVAKIKIKLSNVTKLDEKSPVYQVTFKSKSAKWKYYILAATETEKIEIKDRNENILFSQLKEPKDSISTSLKLNFPEKELFVFESNTTINYSTEVFKNIQLFKNENRIIKHLSNPSINDNGVQIIKIN